MGSSLIRPQTPDELVTSEFKLLNQTLKELVGNEEFQDRLRNELKSELYRSANNRQVEYRRGKRLETLSGG